MEDQHRCWPSARISLAVFALALICFAGCGDGRLAVYKVSGTVTVDGAPAEHAMVVFCPVNPSPELAKLRPYGLVDASGKFTLFTFDPGDGAPAGDYKVLVKWPSKGGLDPRDPPPAGTVVYSGPDRLKGKYYNLDTTPLKVTIEKKNNELAPFNLQSK